MHQIGAESLYIDIRLLDYDDIRDSLGSCKAWNTLKSIVNNYICPPIHQLTSEAGYYCSNDQIIKFLTMKGVPRDKTPRNSRHLSKVLL